MTTPEALAASLADAEARRNIAANTIAQALAYGLPISDSYIAEWSEADDLVAANKIALRHSIDEALAALA